ncbi:MAG TPA: helix-turn-helix domain-containing protein [Dehalococcoidia bacterium]|jgi:excisionase family DNA binding protein|nr:helix-turn-helix domain-containing protein [Dehalococcoidia bacterium]
MEGTLLTLEQVAEYLGVHRDTVYKLVRSGRLPALQLGGRKAAWRISEDDLREFIAKGKTASVAAPESKRSEAELRAFDEAQRQAMQDFQDSQVQRRLEFVRDREAG